MHGSVTSRSLPPRGLLPRSSAATFEPSEPVPTNQGAVVSNPIRTPGVYVEEVPSGVRTISPAPTSRTAFVGRARRGPVNQPISLSSFADYERDFGGLWAASAMSSAVRDFFANGGTEAIIVRLVRGASTPSPGDDDMTDANASLILEDFLPPEGEAGQRGLYALEKTELFSLLCLPPYLGQPVPIDIDTALVSAAATYCERRRAMLLLDAPSSWRTADEAAKGVATVGTSSANAALYFPRVLQSGTSLSKRAQASTPCGAIAGVFARTDAQRGVWKAPAGVSASLRGVTGLSAALTDREQSLLNPLAVNCLKELPGPDFVIWGARTLQGADSLGSEFKYVNVRRLHLHIEESLRRGLEWVVFEPNDQPLWTSVRGSIENFLLALFRAGAFQGSKPSEAFFVRCDSSTTIASDIQRGVFHVQLGFAPLKPAEFVIMQLELRSQQP